MMTDGRTGSNLLGDAKKRRRDLAKILRVCACAWPLEIIRNGSGHADDCPAHALWKENRGYTW